MRVMTLKANEKYFEVLDKASKQLDMNRSLLIRNLIVFSLLLLRDYRVINIEDGLAPLLERELEPRLRGLLEELRSRIIC